MLANPLVDLPREFKEPGLLALSIFVFKFVHLDSIILIRNFSAHPKISSCETGTRSRLDCLAQFAVVWLVAAAISSPTRGSTGRGLT